ncbi:MULTISPECIES: hypothetical protein [Echinicola]|uniref:Uncharacterized protein n=1 Tax=Echinicola arenosa TaxID=2774144 RepID=A0ABR9AKA1_9BACT|nr:MULTISPECIES: hypothetical protein [Echinicola]MBD8489196.1 hypothetical protein [Echinicola arenosa]
MKERKDDITRQIENFKRKMKSQMPKIRKEIKVYENNVAMGIQNKHPQIAPQFK